MGSALHLTAECPPAFAGLWPPLGSYRYRVYYGGRGSGKSWQIARRIVVRCLERPTRVLCVREYQASIRDSVHHLLADQIERLGLAAHYDVGAQEITAANGSAILFGGLRRNPHSVRSTEGVDLCWIEEGQAITGTSWRTLDPTIRAPDSEIWVSMNPINADDALYRTFLAGAPPPRTLLARVSYADNPWLSDVTRDQIADLRQRDPEAYAHVWGGEPWTRADTQVLADRCHVESFDVGADWDGPYLGVDFGFAKDPTVIVVIWRHADRLYVSHADGGVGWDLDTMARRFAAIPHTTAHTMRCDAARPETIHELTRRGFRAVAAPKWSGSVADGVAYLRGYAEIVISPACAQVMDELRLYRYATNDAGDVLPKIVDTHNHYADAMRYALAPLIRYRPAPRALVHG